MVRIGWAFYFIGCALMMASAWWSCPDVGLLLFIGGLSVLMAGVIQFVVSWSRKL